MIRSDAGEVVQPEKLLSPEPIGEMVRGTWRGVPSPAREDDRHPREAPDQDLHHVRGIFTDWRIT
jgi:hypothetical protein